MDTTRIAGQGISTSNDHRGPTLIDRARVVAYTARLNFDLMLVCPRLARAHRQHAAELVTTYHRRRYARQEVQALERLVAHRDLQLARAWATPSAGRGYMAQRERKLADARRRLARASERLQELGG